MNPIVFIAMIGYVLSQFDSVEKLTKNTIGSQHLKFMTGESCTISIFLAGQYLF